MGFVQFDEMIVALDPHGAARHVMDEIVPDSIAHAVQPHARRVGVIDARKMMDVTVLDQMLARSPSRPRTDTRGVVTWPPLPGSEGR